jgi:hypothetical protein
VHQPEEKTLMKRILFLAVLPVLLLLSACTPPPDCECDHIAVPGQDFTWTCVKVSDLEKESGQPVPPEAYEHCVAPEPEPVAPSVWLADVCEPNDGFSADGNMTIATDLAGSTLYAAPSMDGPWTAVAVSGPPWVVTRATLETLGVQVGAATTDALWLKAGDGGYPANLGALIAGREARMESLCGG